MKICYISESTAGADLWGDCWPERLRRMLLDGGVDTELVNCAYSGMTFYQAATSQIWNGKTAVQRAIQSGADVVLVDLGANDLMVGVDGRTLAQVQGDAQTVFSALRAGMPRSFICHVQKLGYDRGAFTPSSLLNKGIMPIFRQVGENQDSPVNMIMRTKCADWEALNAYIVNALRPAGLLNEVAVLDLFCAAARPGLTVDRLHPNHVGQHLLAAQMYDQFLAPSLSAVFPAFAELKVQPTFEWLWSQAYYRVGNGWVRNGSESAWTQFARWFGFDPVAADANWYEPK